MGIRDGRRIKINDINAVGAYPPVKDMKRTIC